MRSLKQSLAEYPLPLLQGIAQAVGLDLAARDANEAATLLATHLLDTAVVSAVVEGLSPAAREALEMVRTAPAPVPWVTFVRRYGPVREMGPQRLAWERPWSAPESAAEELLYRGLVFRTFLRQGRRVVEIAYVPPELALVIPVSGEAPSILPLQPTDAPEHPTRAQSRFLEDMVTLLAFIYNEGLEVDWEGRPLRAALAAVGERFLVPLNPQHLRHPPPRVHLLFHHVQALNLVTQEGNRLRVIPKKLSAWLAQPRAYQRLTLWRAWAESSRWNDLCQVPSLECGGGGWHNDPLNARQRVLAHLTACRPDTWYTLADFINAMYEHDPDFQRLQGDYDTWLLRRRGEDVILRGFEHWHEVEGALLRFFICGPMAWLDAVALDDEDTPTCFAITEAGSRWLHRRSEPMSQQRLLLVVTPDFRVHAPIGIAAFDRFRLARFADWERSWPGFTYRITRHSLQRAAAQGVDPRRILAFLDRATGNALPRNVRRALSRFKPSVYTRRT